VSEEEGKGSSFLVEVTEVRDHGGDGRFQLNAGVTKKIVGATGEMVEAVRGAVKDVCQMALGAFESANRPDELSVKFGVKVGGKTGGGWVVLVTEAHGEATIEIEAKWKNTKT
jgi:uncharacterized protein YaaQ